jgi:hypothetical protein
MDVARRRRWLLGLAAGATFFAVGFTILAVLAFRYYSPRLRAGVERALSDYFGSDVQIGTFEASLFPTTRIEAGGVVLRYKARRDVPALVTIERLTAEASPRALLRSPAEVQRVQISGMHMHVPPRPRPAPPAVPPRIAPPSESRAVRPPPPIDVPAFVPPATDRPILIREILVEDMALELIPRNPSKPARVFEIHKVTLVDFTLDQPVAFTATLTNPKPVGEIATTGSFGPWNQEDPSLTLVNGTYEFSNADLSTIKGIGGILRSTGKFSGPLERIEVSGHTETPDFRLTIGRHPMALTSDYEAIVDGTSGDTWLTPVRAKLASSPILAQGGVVKERKDIKGRRVTLDVVVDKGRIEDFLRLAVKAAQPLMTGTVALKTAFDLPPGEADVPERLFLDGEFLVASANFTSASVQDKVDELSRRGQGRPQDETVDNVISNLRGRFTMKDGVLRFPDLRFEVRGATVRLRGHYVIRGEAIDFRGELRLAARVSKTTTGMKSFFLKIVDPLFAKDGAGTVLPIKITGSAENPTFGVEVGKIF